MYVQIMSIVLVFNIIIIISMYLFYSFRVPAPYVSLSLNT